MIHVGAFAPALEHRHSSNEEQNNCGYSQNLQQHHDSSQLADYLAGWPEIPQ